MTTDLSAERLTEVIVVDHRGTMRGLNAVRLRGTLVAEGSLTVEQLRRRHWRLTDAQFGAGLIAGMQSGLLLADLDERHRPLAWVGCWQAVAEQIVAVNPALAVAA